MICLFIHTGCVVDIRYSEVHMPLAKENEYATLENSQVTDDCSDDTDFCDSVTCVFPFICVNLWHHAECRYDLHRFMESIYLYFTHVYHFYHFTITDCTLHLRHHTFFVESFCLLCNSNIWNEL